MPGETAGSWEAGSASAEPHGLQVSLITASNASAPTTARHFVRSVALALRGGIDPDTVALLTSELVANAVATGPADVEVSVAATSAGVRVSVRDGGGGTPCVTRPGPHDAAGRGLLLVELLSARWGYARQGPQTCVWFEVVSESHRHAEHAGGPGVAGRGDDRVTVEASPDQTSGAAVR